MIYLYRAQEAAGFELRVVPPRTTCRSTPSGCSTPSTTAPRSSRSRTCCSGRRSSWTPRRSSARAREVGAAVILDTYQSAGIMPVDVTALGVDFAVGGCLKWLCGGPGNAFLYTRPDLAEDGAAVVHRLAVAGSARSPSTSTTPTCGTMRCSMMNGTPAIPAYYAALAGLDIIAEVGGRAHPREVEADDGAAAGAGRRARLHVRRAARSRTSGGHGRRDVPDALQVSRTLKARDFVVDYRPPVGIRISPHFYNTMDEIDRIMAEMARSWRKRTMRPLTPDRE